MLLVLVKLLTGHREVVQLLNTTPSVVRSHLLILSLKSILGYTTMCCLIKTGKSSSIFPPLFHCLIQCAIISSIVPLSHPLSIHCLVISSTVLPLFHYHIRGSLEPLVCLLRTALVSALHAQGTSGSISVVD